MVVEASHVGLLNKSFQPSDQIRALRTIGRQRVEQVRAASMCIQRLARSSWSRRQPRKPGHMLITRQQLFAVAVLVPLIATTCGCNCWRCRVKPAATQTLPSPLPVPLDAIVPTDSNGTISPATAASRFGVSADGAATFSYAIWIPQGRRNIEPNLAVVYNSGSGNGLLGTGWSLSGLSSITPCKRDMARDGYNAAVGFPQPDMTGHFDAAFCMATA